ncbi:MAG: beta-ketoacyl-[acyl-carrier-protein] synthase family protein [Pirellulales bacterium]|nr:beta-ketoacyl-[acyl-carrier-protein] synthase family protein [Pirellulales bacterium]
MSSAPSAQRRVVITGMGLICPLGSTPDELWTALQSRANGVQAIEQFDASALPAAYAGEAKQFTGHVSEFGELQLNQKKAIRKGLKTICREAQMGIAAAQLAMQNGGVVPGNFDPEQTGAVFGSDFMVSLPGDFLDSCKTCLLGDDDFDYSKWAQQGLPALNPLWLLKYLPNMPAAHLSMYNDLRGPNNSITVREASSNLAMCEAARIIARGHAERMIAGATGSWIHPLKTVQAVLQFELATNETPAEEASRPFDRDRTGMVLGEGAAALILEEEETAKQRGVPILGRFLGAGASQVSNRNLVADRRATVKNAIVSALRDAELSPANIGHIHAHGDGTRHGDAEEAAAIADVFRDKQIPVTSAKGNFGNLGAGSGLVETIASTMALREGTVPPVRNFESTDEACPVNVVNANDVSAGGNFLNINVTLQGQASCVIVGKAD